MSAAVTPAAAGSTKEVIVSWAFYFLSFKRSPCRPNWTAFPALGGTVCSHRLADLLSRRISCSEQPWELFETKMRAEGLSQAAVDAFKHNYEQLVAGVTGLVRGAPHHHHQKKK